MANTLGNLARNSQDIQLNAELNFVKLYGSIPVLKKLDAPPKPKKKAPKNKEEETEGKGQPKSNTPKATTGSNEMNGTVKFLLRPLLMVRRISVTYDQKDGTILPGFVRTPTILGQNWDDYPDAAPRPGLDFLFGYQPELRPWLEWAAAENLITDNLYLNTQASRNHTLAMSGRINLEPIRDLKIDINANLSHNSLHNEFYKVDSSGTDAFRHLSKIDVGSFTTTTFTLPTMFDGLDTSNIPLTFRQFEANRTEISERFRALYEAEHPGETLETYFDPINDETVPGFYEGYGPYSQDVLIPSFLAAYRGRPASNFNLNPFNLIPLPNWKITYNGLNKIGIFKVWFNAFTVNHGYSSTLSVNNYRNNLSYDDRYYASNFDLMNDDAFMDYLVDETIKLASRTDLDTLSNNFLSYFQIPQVIISEQLSPLIGIDFTTKNNISGRFEYRKSRLLGMSFQDYQLSESRSDEFTVGAGYRIAGLGFPIKIGKRKITLDNELAFNFDFSYRNNLTTLYRLDQDVYEPTSGTRTIQLAPTIDYTINEKLRLSLFYEWNAKHSRRVVVVPCNHFSWRVAADV